MGKPFYNLFLIFESIKKNNYAGQDDNQKFYENYTLVWVWPS